MEHKQQRYKVGKRLSRALRNKRVQMAFATLLVALIVNIIPNLEGVQNEILAFILALILALVGDYTVRDAARIGHEHGQNGLNEESESDEDTLPLDTYEREIVEVNDAQ